MRVETTLVQSLWWREQGGDVKTTRYSRFLGQLVLRWFFRRLAEATSRGFYRKTDDELRVEWVAWYLTGTRFDWYDGEANRVRT